MPAAMKNRYGRLSAWVYDIDKPTGRSFGDIEFYRARLAGVAARSWSRRSAPAAS
jgi:hypothetical protein